MNMDKTIRIMRASEGKCANVSISKAYVITEEVRSTLDALQAAIESAGYGNEDDAIAAYQRYCCRYGCGWARWHEVGTDMGCLTVVFCAPE